MSPDYGSVGRVAVAESAQANRIVHDGDEGQDGSQDGIVREAKENLYRNPNNSFTTRRHIQRLEELESSITDLCSPLEYLICIGPLDSKSRRRRRQTEPKTLSKCKCRDGFVVGK